MQYLKQEKLIYIEKQIISFGGGGGNRTPVRERPLLGLSPGSACVWDFTCGDPTGRVSAG